MNYEKNIYIIETVNLFNAFVFFGGALKIKCIIEILLFFIQCIPNMH